MSVKEVNCEVLRTGYGVISELIFTILCDGLMSGNISSDNVRRFQEC